jgi:hypothetical protein
LSIVTEHGDDNKVTVSHHGLINVSQEYKATLSSPLHSGSLFPPSINQTQAEPYPHLDMINTPCHLYQSPSHAIGPMISLISAVTALTPAVQRVSRKSTSRRSKRKRERP